MPLRPEPVRLGWCRAGGGGRQPAEGRPVSLGGRESSELTASDGNGDGRMPKPVNLHRSLGVGDQR